MKILQRPLFNTHYYLFLRRHKGWCLNSKAVRSEKVDRAELPMKKPPFELHYLIYFFCRKILSSKEVCMYLPYIFRLKEVFWLLKTLAVLGIFSLQSASLDNRSNRVGRYFALGKVTFYSGV